MAISPLEELPKKYFTHEFTKKIRCIWRDNGGREIWTNNTCLCILCNDTWHHGRKRFISVRYILSM
uniref:Uncharacterized protein n=1 Tax=Helianthus annuus TaxID=4232 RepID=A0A251VKK3_HELAN